MRRRRGTRRGVRTYIPRESGLEPALPQAFYREANFQINVFDPHHAGPCVYLFHAIYGACAFLDFVVSLDDYQWVDSQTIQVGPLQLKSTRMDEIAEYDPLPEEEEWDLPKCYKKSVHAQILGITEEPKPVRKTAEERVREVRKGLITAIELAEEYKIEPRDFRGLLRKSGVKKPTVGWAWPDEELGPIRKLLEAHLPA